MRKIILGDCLKVMERIKDKSIDMILCDLPYGKTACEWDVIIPANLLWNQYKRIIKDNGVIALTASQPFTSMLVMSNLKMFRYEWIWLKGRGQNFASAKKQFMRAHESILIFYSKQPVYNPQMTEALKENIRKVYYEGDAKYNSKVYKSNVYGVQRKASEDYDPTKRYPLSYGLYKIGRSRDKIHPTQKPVALFEYFIKTYTNEDDLVLDNCAGSGTTGIACINLKRNFILIDNERKYYDMMRKRIKKAYIKSKQEEKRA